MWYGVWRRLLLRLVAVALVGEPLREQLLEAVVAAQLVEAAMRLLDEPVAER